MTESAILNIVFLCLIPATIIALGIGSFLKGIGRRAEAKAEQAASEAEKAKYEYKLAQIQNHTDTSASGGGSSL